MSRPAYDLVVVGGGIVGLSVAVHAARGGATVALFEFGPLGGESTQRSGALVRAHYADPSSARLALRGLEQFESFEELYGGPSGFRATGFAYVPATDEVEGGSFAARVAMLRGLGVDTTLVDGPGLRALDPSLDARDVECVAYEPRSGYAVPALTCATLAGAAAAAGASLHPGAAVAAVESGGVRLADGASVSAGAVVLCAGARSARLAHPLGIDLPIRPTAVKLAFVERAVRTHLTVIDAPNGTYFRPEGDGATLVGRRTWTDEPLDSADDPLPEVDAAFCADARERLVARLPSAAGARIVGSRAGMLDMTPDGLPLVGPAGVEGLWLCCGWSGTGFKTGPAVGEALASWIAGGERPEDLAAFAPGREMREPAGARSPH